MTKYDIKRLGLILAVQTEIEGMKAENEDRKFRDESMAYSDGDFNRQANRLRCTVYKNDEDL